MGWGDAWAGLSQQSFGLAVDSLRGMQQNKYQKERDQIAMKAEDAREKARRQYEERMIEKRAALEAQARKDQQQFSLRLSDKEFKQQSMRDSASAAREMSDPYRQQMIAESQARVNQMNQPAPMSSGSGLSQQSRAVNTQVNTIRSEFKGKPVEEAYREAAAKYGTELAQAAFPGVAAAASNVAKGLSLFDSASDLAKSYLNF